MAKPLLILMLLTAQLLTGSSVSVYLCIASDGSLRTDTGPDSCTSCQDTCSDSACGALTAERHGSERQGRNRLLQTCEVPALETPCDCVHIPIVTSSDQPARTAQSSITLEFEQLSSLVAPVSSIGLGCLSLSRPNVLYCDVCGVHDFTLTVISTVIIRC
jgi:hypothetical protein